MHEPPAGRGSTLSAPARPARDEREKERVNMKRVCVNCGSSPGARPEYVRSARSLGKTLAENEIDLVYGGAEVGLMGAVADAVLEGGGSVIGVIPEFLDDRVGHDHLSELYIVNNMHERKEKMSTLSDGFIAAPGGMGTLEEIFEVLTWAQLGLHGKPCGFLNVEGYYDHLLRFLDHATDQRFINQTHRDMVLVDGAPDALIQKMMTHQAPVVDKWLDMKN